MFPFYNASFPLKRSFKKVVSGMLEKVVSASEVKHSLWQRQTFSHGGTNLPPITMTGDIISVLQNRIILNPISNVNMVSIFNFLSPYKSNLNL